MKIYSFIFALIVGVLSISPLQGQEVKQTLYVDKAGTLISLLTEAEANSITHLVLTGNINAIDFRHMRDEFEKLAILDISNVTIKTYAGKLGTHSDKFYVYPPNCVPAYAFCRMENGRPIGKQTLKKVVLSEKIKNIEDAAFLACDNLYICQIRKKTAPNLLDYALSDTLTAIFIPVGTRDEYRLKNQWGGFSLIEADPVEAHVQVGAMSSLKDELQIQGIQPKDVHFITIEGKLDEEDLKLIMDYMPNLVDIDIANTTVTHLPDFVFAQKKYMLRIKLPIGLQSIGQRAFSGCTRLSGTVVIPSQVTSLGYGAFMGCEKLLTVYVSGNQLTAIGENLFGDSNGKLVYSNK